MKLPEWKLYDDGYYNRVGVYIMYLKNREQRWILEIWEDNKYNDQQKLLTEYHFITQELDSLKRVAFDCLSNILKQIR